MSKISDLRLSRDMAGTRFKAAVDELHEAFVDLAALDQALANGNVGGEHLATLGHPPDIWSLAHPRYCPYQPANWNDEIEIRRSAYIEEALK
jgi:hypothetical protein